MQTENKTDSGIIHLIFCCWTHLCPLLLGFFQLVHLYFLGFGWKDETDTFMSAGFYSQSFGEEVK